MASNQLPNHSTRATALSPTTDQLSMEFFQLTSDICNQRANVQQYLEDQYLQTINTINNERANHDMLVGNYAARLVTLINEKEEALARALRANSVLQRSVAGLTQEIAMMQLRSAPEPDAGSSCGEVAPSFPLCKAAGKDGAVEVSSPQPNKQADEEE